MTGGVVVYLLCGFDGCYTSVNRTGPVRDMGIRHALWG